MSKYYLYGADVQGIQGFIFKTNELKDIVAASDKVKKICDDLFFTLLGGRWNDDHAVINAAGKVRYIFDTREDCEYAVRNFPRLVLEYAPGITVSQAVVGYDSDEDYAKTSQLLEDRLKTQRNRPMASTTIGLMGIKRDPNTNLPVQKIKIERQNIAKTLCEDAFGRDSDNKVYLSAFDTDQLNQVNDWIAVVHVDGNGLGKIVQSVCHNMTKYRNFSRSLDKVTKAAARKAFEDMKEDCLVKVGSERKVAIRPIVLGGDDFSFICRADLALRYTGLFMNYFEKLSANNQDLKQKLTACAGIAYVKSSFPFYYAYNLAEQLCDKGAKAEAKALVNGTNEPAPSCLMFHKVSDSFYTDYKDIEDRELTAYAAGENSDPTPVKREISFKYGSYYLYDRKGRWTIDKLLKQAEMIKGKEGNAIKSRLRNWLSLVLEGNGQEWQELLRLKSIIQDDKLKKFVDEVTDLDKNGNRLPIYDILAIHTINNQVTKDKKKKS